MYLTLRSLNLVLTEGAEAFRVSSCVFYWVPANLLIGFWFFRHRL